MFCRGCSTAPGADKINVCHSGTLFHNHDQNITVDFDPHILEQAKAEQGTNGGGAFVVALSFTDPEGQGCKDGSGLNTLQTFNPNVTHREGVNGPGSLGHQQTGRKRRKGSKLKSI